jgi:hypothetical protein
MPELRDFNFYYVRDKIIENFHNTAPDKPYVFQALKNYGFLFWMDLHCKNFSWFLPEAQNSLYPLWFESEQAGRFKWLLKLEAFEAMFLAYYDALAIITKNDITEDFSKQQQVSREGIRLYTLEFTLKLFAEMGLGNLVAMCRHQLNIMQREKIDQRVSAQNNTKSEIYNDYIETPVEYPDNYYDSCRYFYRDRKELIGDVLAGQIANAPHKIVEILCVFDVVNFYRQRIVALCENFNLKLFFVLVEIVLFSDRNSLNYLNEDEKISLNNLIAQTKKPLFSSDENNFWNNVKVISVQFFLRFLHDSEVEKTADSLGISQELFDCFANPTFNQEFYEETLKSLGESL